MRLYAPLAAVAVALTLAVAVATPAAGQPAGVGCSRPNPSRTTVTRALGPSAASNPVIHSTAILANGFTALFPELVEVTTVTNYRGVEGLTRTTVHSTIFGDQTYYVIPDWLLRAYAGDIGRILADIESGRLADVGPCP